MNTKKTLLVVLTISVLLSFLSCKPKDWAIKIDDDVISIKEFNDLYYTQNKLMFGKEKAEIDKLAKDASSLHSAYRQFLDKEIFMEFVVNRTLIYRKAKDDKTIDQEELNAVLNLYRMQQVMAYFLKEKLKDEIKITDEDIDRYYKKNQQQFIGVPLSDKVIDQIKLRIQMEELEKKSSEYVKRLVDESKIKRDFKDYLDGKKKSGWIAKIDSDEITVKEFETYYYTQHKIMMNLTREEIDKQAQKTKDHPTLNKENYFDQLIRAHLVYKKALAEMKKDELKCIMDLINLQAIPAYYLSVILKDKIKVADEEVVDFYNKNNTKAKFLIGKPLDEATKVAIKRRMTGQKFEYESQKFIMLLKEESRIFTEGLRNYIKEQNKLEDKKDDTKKTDDTKK